MAINPSNVSNSNQKDHSIVNGINILDIRLRLLITTIMATCTFLLVSSFINLTTLNLLHCGQGLASLGCAIIDAFLTIVSFVYFISTLASTLVGILSLVTLRVKYPLFIGLFVGIVNLASDSIGFTFSEYLHIPGVATYFIFYLMGLVIGYVIFLLLKVNLLTKVGISLLVAVAGFCILFYSGHLLYYLFITNEEKNNVAELNKQAETGDKTGFYVYMPTVIPQGYHLYENSLNPYTKPNYYVVDYLYKNNDSGDPSPFTINSFAKPTYYNPPADCGLSTPDQTDWNLPHQAQACQFIAKLENASELYYAAIDNTTDCSYYTVIGNTEVTLSTDLDYGKCISYQDAIAIFNSLQIESSK